MPRFSTNPVTARWLAGPLSIWGKLPSHGDFLRHRTTAAQAQAWQAWVSRIWSQRPAPAMPRRPHAARRGGAGWVSLEPQHGVADLADVPVAFVMQAGSMPFSPRHCVQGVLVASSDQVGRPCPLIIFQQIAPGWLRRTWADPAVHGGHNLLYWLARIAARTHAADRSWQDLSQVVDAMDALHRPSWRNLLGAPQSHPSNGQLEALVQQFCPQDAADVAQGLRGVQRMPWAYWPAQILRAQQPAHAFWQQDMQGGYVNASESLPALWRAHP